MMQSFRLRLWSAALIGCGLLVPVARGQDSFYVDEHAAGPAHDGATWCSAFIELDQALGLVAPGDTILVADGTYTPDPTGLDDPREATFRLADGVTIRGGFAGCGALDPDERNVAAYESLLSGDLSANDNPDPPAGLLSDPTRNENSYHVVTAGGTSVTTVLDGFTIAAGQADGLSPEGNDKGGGMYSISGSPTVTDCTFRSNAAGYRGGGMYNEEQSGPALTNCTFINNLAGVEGGAVCNWFAAGPTLTDCTFAGNSAGYGGAIYNYYESSPALTGCTFTSNVADYFGGAMGNYLHSDPTLTGCNFAENSSNVDGGAMGNYFSSPTLTDCAFADNGAGNRGGAVYCGAYSNPILTGCTLRGNLADVYGGALYSGPNGSPVLTNCLLRGNLAGQAGAGVYSKNSDPTLANCTFHGNSAPNGTAVACDSYLQQEPSTVEIINCILWDGGDEIWNSDESRLAITYSDIQGGWAGVGNLNADPLFVPGQVGCFYLSQTDAGDLRQSPCIDAGSATASSLGLGNLTTRSDEVPDASTVDMGFHGPTTGRPLIRGDFDRNETIDLSDFAEFHICLTGQGAARVSPCCRIFDFEADDDVDLKDFAGFQVEFHAP